ncbi:hypothetical protein P4E94_19330 [Pontiellaceae bacterium B12219]|nr:hypothetical protein [Pontiellaceae bacterium B12219]
MIVFSVCDYSGNWSRPYKEAGHTVLRFDPKLPHDPKNGLYSWTAQDLVNKCAKYFPAGCDVLLMAPPCTDFSIACNRLWKEKDMDGRTAFSLEIVDACLLLVLKLKPDVWALENPVGRLWKLRPELGKPWYFNPCDFGDPYTKKTGLVGEFLPPLPLFYGSDFSVKPKEYRRPNGQKDSYIETLRGSAEERRAARSNTPEGFAKAFFLANSLGVAS